MLEMLPACSSVRRTVCIMLHLCLCYLLLLQQDDSGTPVSGQDAEEDRNKAGIG